MTENLKPGDTVVLKSNVNVLMTIESIEGDYAWCTWFHPGNRDLLSKKIAIAALAKAS